MKKTFLKIHILSDVIIISTKSRVEKRSRLVNRKFGGISDIAQFLTSPQGGKLHFIVWPPTHA